MKNIKFLLWGVLIGISALWFLADDLIPEPFTYFSFRFVVNQYTGILSISLMSIAMLLATRPRWLENYLNGLDKGYRLHKWLGISALITALTHFWFTHGTKWMVGWGWLERPLRQRQRLGQNAGAGLEQWLGGMRGIAESIGEWAFYLALILMIVSLVKKIPYRWFVKFHKWLAAAYLALVFHSVVLIKFEYWHQPIGWVTAVLLAVGAVSALLILFNLAGKKIRYQGTIRSARPLQKIDGLDLTVNVPTWQGHKAGQFAFVRALNDTEKPHPFSFASAWDPASRDIRFCIKALGDYTDTLAQHWKANDKLLIEGPYGRFTFTDDAQQQIWIATGIGITPFMARLEELAQSTHKQTVDLFYSYRESDPVLIAELQQKSAEAGINLHLRCSAEQSRLTSADIINTVKDLTKTSFWYCGISAFGDTLRKDLCRQGLPASRFHQELFEMR